MLSEGAQVESAADNGDGRDHDDDEGKRHGGHRMSGRHALVAL